ncbi:MAG: hypothetical protein LGB73_01555 [Sulfurovum sp.]|nr:hypothetical protein [Sulfurovum sp.]
MPDTNIDNLSDEELVEYMNNLEDEPTTTETNESQSEADVQPNESDDTNGEVEDTVDSNETNSQADTETDLDEGETDTEDDDSDGLESASQTPTEEDDTNVEDDTEGTEPETTEASETSEEPDYKAFYEKVTADYKANGKIMPGVKNPEDLVAALQMASNYAKKTAAIKPSLKRVKMLKDVTDEELNEMLDFRARKPEVIKKALKEAQLDPLDIDVDEEIDYTPTDYSIPDSQVQFEEAISRIEHTPEFEITSKVVAEQWDEASRQAMFANPQLIIGLNEEVALGRFEKVSALMEQARALGKDRGLNDLELYQTIVTDLAKQEEQTQPNTPTNSPKPKVESPNPADLNEQRKKAGIRQKKKATAVKEYDPTTLSDEEFMKLVESGAKFIEG